MARTGRTVKPAVVEPEKPVERRPQVVDSPGAPVVFFEGTAGYRNVGGIITIGVYVAKVVPLPDQKAEAVLTFVGHLKGTHAALTDLRSAIDAAILLGAKVEGQSN